MLNPMALMFPDAADLPEGFGYHDGIVSPEEEKALLDRVRALAFGEVRMRGHVARRRTIHFGWTYGYETWRIASGPPIPAFMRVCAPEWPRWLTSRPTRWPRRS